MGTKQKYLRLLQAKLIRENYLKLITLIFGRMAIKLLVTEV